MPNQTTKNPWHDRFASPTTDDLHRLYPDEPEVFGCLLELIESRTGAPPAIEWRGIAWRWTLVYRRAGDEEPWAYVIPSERCPILTFPAPANPLPPSDLKRMPRFIRESVLHAPRVGQVCWIESPVETPSQVQELDRFLAMITEAQPA